MWDILCCCPEKEAEKELGTAPCTPTPAHHPQRGCSVWALSLPTTPGPRQENPLSSQGLLSNRSCFLGRSPILAFSSHGPNPLSVSPFLAQ